MAVDNMGGWLYLHFYYIQSLSYMGCLSNIRVTSFLLVVKSENREYSALTPTHWAFSNLLWVEADTKMATQYLPDDLVIM